MSAEPMNALDQKLKAAREAYRSVRYRGPALAPELPKRRAGWPSPSWGWRPALAAAALLAALLAVLLGTGEPDRPPAQPAASAPPALTSPMDTLSAARRAMAATTVAPARPSDGLFRLPAPPRPPSRFDDDDAPGFG